MNGLIKKCVLSAAALGLVQSASATLTWDGADPKLTDLTLTSHNIVGTSGVNNPNGLGVGTIETERFVGNVLINFVNEGTLPTGYPTGVDGYQISANYSPTLSSLSETDKAKSESEHLLGSSLVEVPAGWEYAVAKYDGPPNGGYILFYLGGEKATLPMYSHTIWGNIGTEQYGLSNFSVFNSVRDPESAVPEPSTYLTAALLLLPFGVTTLRTIRKTRVS